MFDFVCIVLVLLAGYFMGRIDGRRGAKMPAPSVFEIGKHERHRQFLVTNVANMGSAVAELPEQLGDPRYKNYPEFLVASKIHGVAVGGGAFSVVVDYDKPAVDLPAGDYTAHYDAPPKKGDSK